MFNTGPRSTCKTCIDGYFAEFANGKNQPVACPAFQVIQHHRKWHRSICLQIDDLMFDCLMTFYQWSIVTMNQTPLQNSKDNTLNGDVNWGRIKFAFSTEISGSGTRHAHSYCELLKGSTLSTRVTVSMTSSDLDRRDAKGHFQADLIPHTVWPNSAC